jgi:hypothetical protein
MISSKKSLKVIYTFLIILLNTLFIVNIYQIKKYREYIMETKIREQQAFIESIKDKNITLLPFGIDLEVESLCSPFGVREYFNAFSLVGTGWFTNIPYNKGKLDSYLSMTEKDIFYFINSNSELTVVLIQESLKNNYDCETVLALAARSDNYLLVKFINKAEL